MTTITKTVYIAADGTEFDQEHECQKYEIELAGKAIYGINYHGEKTNFCDPYFVTEVQIVNLPTPEAVNLFCDAIAANNITIDGIDGPGIYGLGINIGCTYYYWEPIDTVITDYELEVDRLRKYKDMLLQ